MLYEIGSTFYSLYQTTFGSPQLASTVTCISYAAWSSQGLAIIVSTVALIALGAFIYNRVTRAAEEPARLPNLEQKVTPLYQGTFGDIPTPTAVVPHLQEDRCGDLAAVVYPLGEEAMALLAADQSDKTGGLDVEDPQEGTHTELPPSDHETGSPSTPQALDAWVVDPLGNSMILQQDAVELTASGKSSSIFRDRC